MTDLGQVFTKNSVAQFMISLCEIRPDDYILDPCFGAGVFIEELHKKGYRNICGCELDPKLYNKISSGYKYYLPKYMSVKHILNYLQNMIIYIAVIF